jgi:hypothetical protein
MDSDKPFGGITVLFSGDYRQTLPVIVKASREQIVSACLRRSPLWQYVQVFHLKTNRRLDTEEGSQEWAEFLLDVGCGKRTDADGTITLPESMRCGDDEQSLIDAVYPNIVHPQPDSFFVKRSILSCRNDDVDDLNKSILSKFPGREKVYLAADTVPHEAGADASGNDLIPYPAEFLASLTASGLPIARLALKEGCPLMLLRNLDPSRGLCNGTRLRLLSMGSHVLRCRILGGTHEGTEVFIPRITLEPTDGTLPFPLRRRQFPVRLAFAMTINKSQGQSLENVGLDLRIPVFSHGQLYVALSRCTSAQRIKALFPEHETGTKTTNIVYPEVLNGII